MAQHSAAASIGIPLHCNICPKKPNFSDTSHLLTHVASKQHLSNYFKLRVRVNTDSGAQRDVDAYDRWYQDWNLDELMRERMNQKEKRTRGGNGGASRRVPAAAAPQVSSSRSGSVPLTMPQPRRESSLRNNLLDPQLGPKIKTEPNTRPSTPYIPSYDPLDQRGYTAPMHGWGSIPYAMSPSQGATSASWASDADADADVDDDDDDTSSYGYAPVRRSRRRKMSEENTSCHGSMSGSLPGSAHPGEDLDGVDVPNDIARLKGDIWPGMDIFDSATLEMRRKRNQKKATSVIIQLQATSEMVTPTELIFDNLGQFKKERVISGEPNEADSPLRGETSPEPDDPPVKKRATRRRPRAALAEKDTNGGRKLRSSARAGSHHPGVGNSRPQYVDSSDDLDEDDALTYGQNRPAQRRSGLSIHRDNTGPDITFDRPSRMSYLTSSFPGPYGNIQADNRSAQPGYGRITSQLNDSGYHSQLTQQEYRTQHRPETAAGFRASEAQQQSARNLSTFGSLASHPLFQANHHEYNAPQMGSNSFPSFQHQFAPVNHMPAVAPSFAEAGSQMQDWDVFGFNNGGLGGIDMNFNAIETTGANPLFYEGEAGMPINDDEGTISVPASDVSPS